MELDLNPLERALTSLEDILRQKMTPYVRDGAIQRFEYTFELTWKALQRYLKESGVETGSPKDVFRAAFKARLIDQVEPWFEFLKSRNLTVHTYNEDVAEEVFSHAQKLPPFTRSVLARLKNPPA